jgi:ABC-type sugar transport system substrate-binding protein
MKHKRLFLLSVLLVLAMMLGACAPAAEEAAPVEEEAMEEEVMEEEAMEEEVAEEEVMEEKFFIGMVQHSSIPYTEQMKVGFDAACEDLPIECEYNAPETINPETAIGMFESMVQKGADAVVLNPAPPEAWTEVIKEAVDAGVLVNTIDNVPAAESGFNVFVAPGTKATAVSLAESFFAELAAKGVTEGKIVWGICAPGYTGQELRADGWEEACANQTDTSFECVGPEDTGHSVELNYAFWETAILQHPDAVGFAGNCAFAGPNLCKLKKLNEADFGIASFDLEPETLECIEEGVVDAAMGINPWLNAYLATQLAYDHLVSGEPLATASQIDSGPELVTVANVADFLAREQDLDLKHSYHLDVIADGFTDLESLIFAME